jgi:DNA-binding CsgD family transcriptional regulator/tetratricopeptide (TPR) repeat protein
VRALLCRELIGRDQPLDIARAALADARRGSGGVLLVSGEAGVGKSRLVSELVAGARESGMQVLFGRAVQADVPIPFRPFSEAFLSHFRRQGLPSLPELAPFRPALGRLLPEWRTAGEATHEPLVVLAEGMVRLLTAAAGEAGALLVLEDMHWADQETLEVLEYFADVLRTQPVLCVATVRSEEASPALRLTQGLKAARTATVLELDALAADDLGRMTAACLDSVSVPDGVPDGLLEYVRTWSDGLPFMVEEVLAGAVGAGVLAWDGHGWSFDTDAGPLLPVSFVENVRGRLRGLGPEPARVLRVAAVLGRRFDWTLLPAAAEVPDLEVMTALRAGVDAQLLVAEPGAQFRFRHALTRDAVLDDLLPAERAIVCAAVLDVVEASHPGLPGQWCEVAARLAEGSGQRERAAGLLLELGRRSLATGALGSAEQILDRARAATSDAALEADIDEVAAEVLALAGKTDQAIVVGSRVADQLRIIDGPATRRANAHLGVARAAVTACVWEVAEDHLARARESATAAADDGLSARVDTVAAHAALGQGRPETALPLVERALATAEELGLHELACEALEVIGRCWRLSDAAASEQAFDRARVIAETHGLALWRTRATSELAWLDTLTGGGDERLRSAHDQALACGAWGIVAHLELAYGQWYLLRFRMDESLERLRRCDELSERLGMPVLLAIAHASELLVHAVLGHADGVERSAEAARAAVGDDPGVNVMVLAGLGMAALVEEDLDATRDFFARANDEFARLPTTPQDPTRGLSVLLSVHDSTSAGEAAALVAAADTADAAMTKLARGYLRFARAVALGRAGRTAEAEAEFTEGEALLREMADGWLHHGFRLAGPPAVDDGWGDPGRWLLEALGGFESRGLTRGADALRALMRGAAIPVPRRGQATPGLPARWATAGVTAREAEVLALLGEGLTNQEIADRVFLSSRTVERHLANVGARLGTRSRSELVALAARDTATD